MAFGTYYLPFAICQAWYPLFHLLRLADTSIGGMDKVKYYVSQIFRLLDHGLQNVIAKWTHPTCPAEKLLDASTRNIDKNTSGLAKTEGLEEECEEESGKYYVTFHLFILLTITSCKTFATVLLRLQLRFGQGKQWNCQ